MLCIEQPQCGQRVASQKEPLGGFPTALGELRKEDMAIIREVKKQVGDNLVLMLDFMWSYHYEEALRVGVEAQELGYFWYIQVDQGCMFTPLIHLAWAMRSTGTWCGARRHKCCSNRLSTSAYEAAPAAELPSFMGVSRRGVQLYLCYRALSFYGLNI
jgi:hypothetical protein